MADFERKYIFLEAAEIDTGAEVRPFISLLAKSCKSIGEMQHLPEFEKLSQPSRQYLNAVAFRTRLQIRQKGKQLPLEEELKLFISNVLSSL